MRSPSRTASCKRFTTRMPTPSPRIVPSPSWSKGRALPVALSAGVFEKHMYMKMSLSVSTPPVMAMSQRPSASSMAARWSALRELAHARVHDAVGAAQVQPVRDPARDDVAEKPWERGLLPFYIRVRDTAHHVLRHLAWNAGFGQCLAPDRMPEARAQGDCELQSACHAHEHTHAVPVEFTVRAVTGIDECPARRV